jgi:hypothetical protein
MKVKSTDSRLNIVRYNRMGAVTVVNLRTVECVIGRVYDRGEWAIVDRQPFSLPSDLPSDATSVDSVETTHP